jgi:hypothetical protein
MPRFIVERTFPEGFAVPADAQGAQVCLLLVGNNSRESVTWVHSYVTCDKKKTFEVYEAPSPEAIRKAAHANNLPVDAISEVSVLDPFFYR